MKVRMMQTKEASPNGINIQKYVAGEIYDVPKNLYEIFIREKWAVPHVEIVRKAVAVPENKAVEVPEKKEEEKIEPKEVKEVIEEKKPEKVIEAIRKKLKSTKVSRKR